MKILIKEHKRKDGSFLGEAALNRPEQLNALNYDTAQGLKKALQKWQSDPKIHLIFLHGLSDKAFCAGGDIKALYHQITMAKKQNQDPAPLVQPFFEQEYPINYILRTYPKPIVTWGGGWVLGGGLGLLAASSHPVVTETSLLAMPEIKIGFFPDVGGSYFLNHLPYDMGWYLALTGCFFNSAEFLYLQMGELFVKDSDKEAFFQLLLSLNFTDKKDLTEKLKYHFPNPSQPENRLKGIEESVRHLFEKKSLENIYEKMQNLSVKNKFWNSNKNAFLNGSPTSLGVVCEQLKKGKTKTLKQIFQMEMVMALQFVRHFDFVEGIRAQVIDKTKDPKWNPSSITQLTKPWIAKHFEAPAGWTNPLDSL